MPGNARKDIVRVGEIGAYHYWSRCVQKAYLCGVDPETKQDYSYRRGWIEALLRYMAGVLALDVGSYNVLSNHAHVILRTRPDIAATWSAEELALRWKLAWPEFIDGQWVREVTDESLDQLLAVPAKIDANCEGRAGHDEPETALIATAATESEGAPSAVPESANADQAAGDVARKPQAGDASPRRVLTRLRAPLLATLLGRQTAILWGRR